MPRRYSINVRVWVYRYLVLRDGEKCALCGKAPATQNHSSATQYLEIDHLNGNPADNDPDNLRLLCKACNIAERNRSHSYSAKNVCVQNRLRAEGNPTTRITKEAVDYSQGSSEMQANFLFETDFRRWILGLIKEQGFIRKSDAISAGAEVVGCSPATARRYLSKLTSLVGPLKEQKDMLGGLNIILKEELAPKNS
jgi:hypothetical protein